MLVVVLLERALDRLPLLLRRLRPDVHA